MTVAEVLCIAVEAALAATHAQVLLALGEPLRYDDLRDRRWYFVVDALAPVQSLRLVSRVVGVPPVIAAGVAAHVALHAFYVATWSSVHTRRVIMMSSDDADWPRRAKYTRAERAWYAVGTLFDIGVHACMAGLLWAALVGVPDPRSPRV